MADYDFAVIGAGHNGLSAACTLTGAGASVVVLEQRDIVGGLSTSYPYLAAAPQHWLSLGAMDDMFMSCTSIVEDLQLRPARIRHHPGTGAIRLARPGRRVSAVVLRLRPNGARGTPVLRA